MTRKCFLHQAFQKKRIVKTFLIYHSIFILLIAIEKGIEIPSSRGYFLSSDRVKTMLKIIQMDSLLHHRQTNCLDVFESSEELETH